MNNLLILGMLVMFLWSILVGLLVGFARGRRKAILRLITLTAAFVLSMVLTPMIGKITLDKSIGTIKDVVDNMSFFGIVESNETIKKISLIFVNPLLFIFVFTVLWLLSLIIYWILAATLSKPKKDKLGNAKSKGRLLGLLVGTVCGFIMFLVYFIPINGYVLTTAKISKAINDPSLTEMMEYEFFGYNLDVEGYTNNEIVNAFGLSALSDACFDYLSSTKVNGVKIVLSDEVDILCRAADKINALDKEKPLSDVDALESAVMVVFESKIVVLSIDPVIEYYIENPSEIDSLIKKDEKESDDGQGNGLSNINSLFSDREMLLTVLTGLKGNVKEKVEACFNVFRTINELDIELTDMNINVISNLSNSNVDKLVTALFNVNVVRDLLPYLIGDIIKPFAESIGIDATYTRPTVTDWQAEKAEIVTIFKSINALTGLMDISGGEGEGSIEEMEEYFNRENAATIGNLMNSLQKSQLLSPMYNSITAFDAQKDEYFFISYLDNMIFSTQAADTNNMLPMILADQTKASSKTIRALFTKNSAIKQGGVSANDNINFDEFDWNNLFVDIADLFSFLKSVKNAENKNLSETSATELVDMINRLDSMDKETIQEVLEALVPADSNIKIPDLANADLKKEAEITQNLFDYQDEYNQKKAAGENMEREKVEQIIDTISESDVILKIFESAGTTIDASKDEKVWIEEKLSNSTYPDETKNAIKKIFGLN